MFRASLLANRIGRQITLALVTVLVAGGVSDVLLWIRGGDTHAAGSASMLAMASVLAGAAIGIDARFALSAAAFLGGAIVCAVWPSMTVLAVGGAAIVAAGIVMVDSIRQARAPEK